MSVEEKIRRAEEIYNRRNGNSYTYRYDPRKKKKQGLMSKMIKQIMICFIIYACFYAGSNKEYFLSEEFHAQVEELASKNEIVESVYNLIKEYWNKYFKSHENSEQDKNDTEQTQNDENNDKAEEKNENQANPENDISSLENETVNIDANIGGSIEELEKNTEKTQEEIDAEEIKNTISFIAPITGTISSTFGWRTPTTATVPKYHTGLDIAATTGTVIKSATDGKIILASSQGDYGKHYKIQINDVIIIYAHCSKLYLNEGDEVKQGQNIAEVGSTGNSTRSTFAF